MLLSGHPDQITLVNKVFMIYLKYFVSIRIKNDLSILKRWEIHLTLCFKNFPVSWRNSKLRELIYVYSLFIVSCHFLRHFQKQYDFCKSARRNFFACSGLKRAIPSRRDGPIFLLEWPIRMQNLLHLFRGCCQP